MADSLHAHQDVFKLRPKRTSKGKTVKKYRKKTQRLEKDLQAAITKNVDLYNRKNKAAAVLRRLTQENRDLLDVLNATLGEPAVTAADHAPLTPEQEELFHLTHP